MYLGDFDVGDIVDRKFQTVDALFAPITIVGGVVSVLKDNGTALSTAGVSLTADFDGRVGSHHLAIHTDADGTFYATGHDFFAMLTAGTVDGKSVVGQTIAHFSLQNRTIRSDVVSVGGDAASAARLAKSVRTVARGVVGASASSVSLPTSLFTVPGTVTNQFVGRIVVFDEDTLTTDLRMQATRITGSTIGANPTLTVDQLAILGSPQAGDTFSVL